nr:MAG TPA: SH3 domain protein [Caudoviricetes sp.]
MIQAEEAIRAARGLIGTSYETLDCINLIKKVIRTAPGGDKRYTTAGTNELWNSFDSVPKYRHLIWRQTGISGAKAGMLAFMGAGTGDVNHTGLVTERGTVLHSSKSRGGVVETALTAKAGWNGLGVHRMIGVDYPEGGKTEVSEAEKIFGNAAVNITSGYLNIREGASTAAKIIAKAENGTRVNVIREAGGTGWVFGKLESGDTGYMSSEYLVEDAPESGDQGETGGEEQATTTLRRSDGVYITLAGKWALAED